MGRPPLQNSAALVENAVYRAESLMSQLAGPADSVNEAEHQRALDSDRVVGLGSSGGDWVVESHVEGGLNDCCFFPGGIDHEAVGLHASWQPLFPSTNKGGHHFDGPRMAVKHRVDLSPTADRNGQ